MMPEPTRVALITGATSGIGRAAALAFGASNYAVVAIGRDQAALAALAGDFDHLPGGRANLATFAADVADRDAMAEAIRQTGQRFGRLDVVIANAGVGHRGPLVSAEWADLERLLRTNIDGALITMRAARPAMSAGSQVFIVSSVAFNLVAPYAAAYAASKAFVSSIAASLRLELADEGIAVTDVIIGRVDTAFDANRLGEGRRRSSGLPTMAPEQVAAAMLKATRTRPAHLYVRPFDRLTVWANKLFPSLIGRVALRQYR
jgi:short-subunit dehydrogenase